MNVFSIVARRAEGPAPNAISGEKSTDWVNEKETQSPLPKELARPFLGRPNILRRIWNWLTSSPRRLEDRTVSVIDTARQKLFPTTQSSATQVELPRFIRGAVSVAQKGIAKLDSESVCNDFESAVRAPYKEIRSNKIVDAVLLSSIQQYKPAASFFAASDQQGILSALKTSIREGSPGLTDRQADTFARAAYAGLVKGVAEVETDKAQSALEFCNGVIWKADIELDELLMLRKDSVNVDVSKKMEALKQIRMDIQAGKAALSNMRGLSAEEAPEIGKLNEFDDKLALKMEWLKSISISRLQNFKIEIDDEFKVHRGLRERLPVLNGIKAQARETLLGDDYVELNNHIIESAGADNARESTGGAR